MSFCTSKLCIFVSLMSVWSFSHRLAFSISCEKGSYPSSVGCGTKFCTPENGFVNFQHEELCMCPGSRSGSAEWACICCISDRLHSPQMQLFYIFLNENPERAKKIRRTFTTYGCIEGRRPQRPDKFWWGDIIRKSGLFFFENLYFWRDKDVKACTVPKVSLAEVSWTVKSRRMNA